MNSLGERLKQAQHQLGLKGKVLALELRISPEWYSKVVNGAVEGSDDIGLRLDDLLRRRGIEPSSIYHLKKGVKSDLLGERTLLESPAYGLTDDTPSRQMPTREDCEAYLRRILDQAQDEGSPENIPAIMHRLKKHFPAEEWGNF